MAVNESSQPKQTIRPAQSADIEAVKTLRLESLQTSPQSFREAYHDALAMSPLQWQTRFGKALGDNAPELIMIACCGDRLIGMSWSQFEADHSQVNAVYVQKAFRRRGIGHQLMLATLSHIHDRSPGKRILLNVNVSLKGAIELYERLGFKTTSVEQDQLYGDGKKYDRCTMTKH